MNQAALGGGSPTIRLVIVPVLISLVVTLWRLTGELLTWSTFFFNPEAGGVGAVIGITWLAPIFGIYFALHLAKNGDGPSSRGRAIGFAVIGFAVIGFAVIGFAVIGFAVIGFAVIGFAVIGFAVIGFVLLMVGGPVWGFLVQKNFLGGLVFIWLLAALTACLQYLGWPQFFKTVLAYGLGARLPVVLIMALAMHGAWGTHYDAIPPRIPGDGWLGFFPQLVFWVGFTIVAGAFFGIPAASLVHRRRTAVETTP